MLPRKKGRRAGFTLLELMVVMVIMCIVLAVQLPRLGGQLTGSSLRSAAQTVSTMAYTARFRAADDGRPHTLVLDSRENRVQLLEQGRGAPLITKRLPDGISMERMEAEGEETDTDLLHITFYPLGTATQAELLLSGGAKDHLRLTVSAADGAVHANAP